MLKKLNDIAIDNKSTASILRIGLGLVFVIGGYNKLSQLFDPERMAGIVGSYTGGKGYIRVLYGLFVFQWIVVNPMGLPDHSFHFRVDKRNSTYSRPYGTTAGPFLRLFVVDIRVFSASSNDAGC